VRRDATKFSETGYVGGDVEIWWRELVHKADGDVNGHSSESFTSTKSTRSRRAGSMIGRDVSGSWRANDVAQVNGRDECRCAARWICRGNPGGTGISKARKSSDKPSHPPYLFVVSGAFERLKEQVSRRVKGPDRIRAEPIRVWTTTSSNSLVPGFHRIRIRAGIIGRLPVRVVC